MTKAISIIAVVALLALIFWVSVLPWVNGEVKFADPGVWVWPLAMLILLSGAIGVCYAILPQRRLKLAASALIGLTYLIAFGFGYLNILGFFVILLLHVFAIRAIHLESQERLKIHPWAILRRGIAEIMVPLYIAISFGYFASPVIQGRTSADVLNPGVKQIAAEVMEKFLESDGNLSNSQRKAVGQAAIDRAYDSMKYFLAPYEKYFPPILAFGLFLVLWGLGFVIYPLATLAGMGIFSLLRVSGIVQIQSVDTKAERIVM